MGRRPAFHRRDLLRLGALGAVGSTNSCLGSPTLRRRYEIEFEFLANGVPLKGSVVQGLRYQSRQGGIFNYGGPLMVVMQEGLGLRVPGTPGAIVTTFWRIFKAVGRGDNAFGEYAARDADWTPILAMGRELLPPSRPGDAEYSPYSNAMSLLGSPSPWASLSIEDLPLLLHFTDVNDSSSPVWIDPNDQSAPIRFVSARARMTDEALTGGRLFEVLPCPSVVGTEGGRRKPESSQSNWGQFDRDFPFERRSPVAASSMIEMPALAVPD